MSPPRDTTGQREETIQLRQNGTNAPDGLGSRRPSQASARGEKRRSETITRAAAGGSLLAAIVIVVLVLFGGGSTYTIRAELPGRGRAGHRQRRPDRPGEGRVGHVDRPDEQRSGAVVTIGIDSNDGADAPGHRRADLRELAVGDREQVRGARAGPEQRAEHQRRRPDRRRQHALPGQPRPAVRHARPADPGGPAGLHPRRGGEHPRQGAAGATETLQYLAPGLASTSDVTAELASRRAGVRQPARAGRPGAPAARVPQQRS